MRIPFSYIWRSLWARRLTSTLTLGGVALVVFVFAGVLMLARGLEATLVDTGSPQNAIVLRRSAGSELVSQIDRGTASVLETQPEVAPAKDGRPLLSREGVVVINLYKKTTNGMSNVVVRGVSPQAFELRPGVRVTQGRPFQFGTHEIVVGGNIADRFKGVALGAELSFGGDRWTVVGIADAGGTGFDSEIWGDADQLMQAFGRPVYSSVTFRLRDPGAFNAVKARLQADPRSQSLELKREQDFYREQSQAMAKFIKILGLVVTTIFSVGAMIGAMITMYAAVASRVVEVGTLRALGFQRRSVLTAFLIESVLLALAGGAGGGRPGRVVRRHGPPVPRRPGRGRGRARARGAGGLGCEGGRRCAPRRRMGARERGREPAGAAGASRPAAGRAREPGARAGPFPGELRRPAAPLGDRGARALPRPSRADRYRERDARLVLGRRPLFHGRPRGGAGRAARGGRVRAAGRRRRVDAARRGTGGGARGDRAGGTRDRAAGAPRLGAGVGGHAQGCGGPRGARGRGRGDQRRVGPRLRSRPRARGGGRGGGGDRHAHARDAGHDGWAGRVPAGGGGGRGRAGRRGDARRGCGRAAGAYRGGPGVRVREGAGAELPAARRAGNRGRLGVSCSGRAVAQALSRGRHGAAGRRSRPRHGRSVRARVGAWGTPVPGPRRRARLRSAAGGWRDHERTVNSEAYRV